MGEAAPEDDLGASAEEDFGVAVGAFVGAVGVLVAGAVVGDGDFFGEAEGASAAKAVATVKANRANTINWRAIFIFVFIEINKRIFQKLKQYYYYVFLFFLL